MSKKPIVGRTYYGGASKVRKGRKKIPDSLKTTSLTRHGHPVSILPRISYHDSQDVYDALIAFQRSNGIRSIAGAVRRLVRESLGFEDTWSPARATCAQTAETVDDAAECDRIATEQHQ